MKFSPRLLMIPAALALTLPCAAHAAPIGKVIFQSGNAFIVGPNGGQRPAHKGDPIQPGERLVTGPNTLAQVKMQDGSFLGVRPGSDLKFQELRLVGPDAGQDISLNTGSVRVLNVANGGSTKPVPITVLAGDARIVMRGADLESAVKRDGTTGPEAITRLNHGEGTLSNGTRTMPLAVNEVNSVTKGGIVDVPVSALPPIDIKPGPTTGTSRTPGLDTAGLPKGPLADPLPRFDTTLDSRGTGGLILSQGLKNSTDATFVPSTTIMPGGGGLLPRSPALPTTILSNPSYTGGANEVAAVIVNSGSVGVIRTEQIVLPTNFVPPPPPPGTVFTGPTAGTTLNTSLTGLTTFTTSFKSTTGTILLRR